MATVWTLHMYNQRQQRVNSFDEIGVFIYDTCGLADVAHRQSVRLISHSFLPTNRVCREAKTMPPPLIGVIYDGPTYDKSLDLFKTFNVPIITTTTTTSAGERPPIDGNSSMANVFTVAPPIRYLSNAIMSLVKELNWRSMSLVVSDEEPAFDSQYLHSLSLKSYNDLNFVNNNNNNNFNKIDRSTNTEFPKKRYRRRDELSDANTIFYLSSGEAMNLLNSLSRNSGSAADSSHYHQQQQQQQASNYSYIIVTNNDISVQIKQSQEQLLKRNDKLRKNVFLVSPLMEKSSEYHNYFETMVNKMDQMKEEKGGDSHHHRQQQPLIAEYRKANQSSTTPHDSRSVSVMVKAVWALTQAYQNLYQRQCTGNKLNNCHLSTNANLTSMMADSLTNLNTVVTDSGLKDINGVRLSFDNNRSLVSWKYQIMIVASNWQTISLGFYSLDTGLTIDSKFMHTILANRINRARLRHRSMIKAGRSGSDGNGPTNTLSSMSSNQLPLYRQPVWAGNASRINISPSSLMRSSVKYHMVSSSTTPIERRTLAAAADEQHSQPLLNNSSSSSSDGQQQQQQSSSGASEDTTPTNHVTRKRFNGLTASLGTMWSSVILSTSILGILVTLYVQTFLLMKSCEGALRKANQALVTCHLIAITINFLGSSLFVFYPTSLLCCTRHTIHNISLTLLFGSLLIRAMYIRAQKSIGLGGRTSRLNQMLTLVFIVGIQTALEYQKWKYEFLLIPNGDESLANLAKLCIHDGHDFIRSQIYITTILSLLLIMCWSARSTPFNQKDGNQLMIVSLLTTMVFIASMVSIMNMGNKTTVKYMDIVIALSMNIYGFLVLLGLFVPLLHTIHKYGILVPKSGSYADSLSTIFTSFGAQDLITDGCSSTHNSSTKQYRDCHNSKISKSFDFHNNINKNKNNGNNGGGGGGNFFARVSPNCYTTPPIVSPYKIVARNTNCSLMHNTLYEGVPGFRSAYP
ncbi:uncharacterized protein LOC128957118 [Oppia nitens]|uniref:uncharacterized protein LOC128957118 n=1 Tax=Oppia nitens TaxID=1686743 RepID=UPI0023DABE0D|nr:uncharacterized protein LOC128957118 [Oppia nitens]